MLIQFRVANFRSFRDEQVLSMVAGPGSEHRDTHTFVTQIPEAKRLLASAALYGPNAAGKTNLLKAMQCMQSIVINSAAAATPSTGFVLIRGLTLPTGHIPVRNEDAATSSRIHHHRSRQ